jgi:hypothetical protein
MAKDGPANCKKPFLTFSDSRSGVFLSDKLSDLVKVDGCAQGKYATKEDGLAARDRALALLYEVLTNSGERTNIREACHAISRITEGGESRYEAGRKANPAAVEESDDWFEHGTLRWIIRQVYNAWDKKKFSQNVGDNEYAKRLLKLGFSMGHLEEEYENLYEMGEDSMQLIKGDVNLDKKGWMNPLAAHLVRGARPNGDRVYDPVNETHKKTKDGRDAFRFAPLDGKNIASTHLTEDLIKNLGLAPVTKREKAFLDNNKGGVISW